MGPWLLAMLAGVSVVAENARAAGDSQMARRVDEHVRSRMRAQQIPGLALGVMRDGKILKATGYGLADVENDVAVTPETVFQMGSAAKSITATAVMMLAEAGSVKLDDEITRFFPEAPAAWKKVTVRHLLSHTSGITDYGAEEETKNRGIVDFHAEYTEDELVQKLVALPLDFQPGEEWSYSNSGYVLLGVLISRVTGQFYGDFLQRRIFEPLGMRATRVISEADIIPHRSRGYRLVEGTLKNQEWVSPSLNTMADGALYTSVLDMAKWDAALHTEKLLRGTTLEEMWTPARLDDGSTVAYGLGWGVVRVNGHRLLRHRGAWQGYSSVVHRYVDDRLSLVILTNLDENSSRPEPIAKTIAAMYLPALAPAGAPAAPGP